MNPDEKATTSWVTTSEYVFSLEHVCRLRYKNPEKTQIQVIFTHNMCEPSNKGDWDALNLTNQNPKTPSSTWKRLTAIIDGDQGASSFVATSSQGAFNMKHVATMKVQPAQITI